MNMAKFMGAEYPMDQFLKARKEAKKEADSKVIVIKYSDYAAHAKVYQEALVRILNISVGPK